MHGDGAAICQSALRDYLASGGLNVLFLRRLNSGVGLPSHLRAFGPAPFKNRCRAAILLSSPANATMQRRLLSCANSGPKFSRRNFFPV
jgi:hypothetical protein